MFVSCAATRMVLPTMIALTAAAKAARVPGASLLQLLAQAGPTQSRAMHTALARSVVLPRLLDTLSTTFQQSSTRMDGLIDTMTQELGKVCQDWLLQQLRHLVSPGLAAFAASALIDFTELFHIVTMWTLQPDFILSAAVPQAKHQPTSVCPSHWPAIMLLSGTT